MNRFFSLALLAGLAACADQSHQALSPDFGNAVSTNIAAQVVNPHPQLGLQDPTSDGRRMGDAMERYRRGRVYAPQPPIDTLKSGDAPPLPPAADFAK